MMILAIGAEAGVGTRFAFDLGTNSIGWAVWRTGPDPSGIFGKDAPLELLRTGVRIFKDGRNPKDQQSLAAMRRVPRSARRRRDRFLLRRRDLLKVLIESGLMPSDPDSRRALEKIDPYRVRAKALDEPLAPFEIGRAIFHLNQRRGFKSNRKTDKGDKDKGKIAEGVLRLRRALSDSNSRTLGEYLWTRHRGALGDPSRPRAPGRSSTRIRLDGHGAKALYEFYPIREMVRDEFDLIWDLQSFHHPSLLTEELREAIAGVLFRQRDLVRPEVGRCTFVGEEERLPKALPSVQAREIYERLNHIRLSSGIGLERPLGPEERDALAGYLLNEPKLTFTKLRKALKLGSEVKINFEEGGESELPGSKSMALVQKVDHFGSRWRSLSWAEKDGIFARLLDDSDEEGLILWLMRSHGLNRKAAENCASLLSLLPDGYSRLGATANAAILQALVAERDDRGHVVTYSDAVLRAGRKVGFDWHHSDIDIKSGAPAPDVPCTLPYYGEVLQRHILPGSQRPEDKADGALFWGRFPNPTIHIALNQLKRVVDALISEFGHPDQIVLELARDLKQSQEQKDRDRKRNSENKRENERRAGQLGDLGIVNDGEARARLRLFEEQKTAGNGVACCPFSGRVIGLEKVFSSEVEIEHLLPWSRTLDDGMANKVLCFRDMNRMKRGRSPFEAFGHLAEWGDIAARAATLSPNKRWRFEADAMDRFEKASMGGLSASEREGMGLGIGFLARQLYETRYMSRLARGYVNHICVRFDPSTGERLYGDVYVTTGALTGMLRGKWGLNSLLSGDNRKNRNDHRHHALDAVVIGAMTRGLLNELARRAADVEANGLGRLVDKMPWPFPDFREAIRAKLEATVASSKPEHGKLGALHEDTAYGLIGDRAVAKSLGNLVRRKPIADLTANEVDYIRDLALRKAVQSATALLRDPKGKIKDEKALRATLEVFREGRGIRRVRVAKEDASVVVIADRRTGKPYKAVAPGENHHIDIVRMRDGSWKGFAATIFEVNRKDFRPQWEREKLGAKLVMRLHKGDAVELDADDGRVVKVVQKISPSINSVVLVPVNEGGNFQNRHDDEGDSFRWDFANIGKLKDRNCVAVRVGPTGRLMRRRTNI